MSRSTESSGIDAIASDQATSTSPPPPGGRAGERGRGRPGPRVSRSGVRARLRRVLLVLGPLLMIAAAVVTYRRASGNLGTVEPGRLYRSAQLSDTALADFVRSRHVRTVLNLRGPNPDQDWYVRELDATLAAGAVHVDLPLASDQWLSREQARTLLETLDTLAYPALVHCEFGAERTGLVAALARLLQPGSTLKDAYDQFSPAYLFVALKDGRVMIGHLDRYAAWLAANRREHKPEVLRSWLLDHYEPPAPSREQWPCDPYPRKVTVARAPDGSIARDEQWPANPCPRTVATVPSTRRR